MPKVKHTREKTASERLVTVNETKMKCIEHDLLNDMATKVLFTMLDNYHENGVTYINKELKFSSRYQSIPRKYVVNLYNQFGKIDTVLIRALDEDEIKNQNQMHPQSLHKKRGPIRSVVETWKRDSDQDPTQSQKNDTDESTDDI